MYKTTEETGELRNLNKEPGITGLKKNLFKLADNVLKGILKLGHPENGIVVLQFEANGAVNSPS